MPIKIDIYPPMTPTRPCRYCLSLQGGGVFADFDVDDSGHVFLVRISFDGYGCCRIDGAKRKMNLGDSCNLIQWVESDNVSHVGMFAILAKYFKENKDIIWEDALVDHELLSTDVAPDTMK